MGYKRVASKHGNLIAETYRCIRERVDFAGGMAQYNRPGTLWGRWEGNRERFVIYSYLTVMAFWEPGTGWTVTNEKYSRTTTGHQSVIRRALSNEDVHFVEQFSY